jgi:hypothetical protein
MKGKSELTNYMELSGLIFACPFGEKVATCPFTSIHKMSIDDRIEFIERMNNIQISSLINWHKACLKSREFKRIGLIPLNTGRNVISAV